MGFCLPAKALQLATGLLSEQRLPLVLDLDDTLVLGKTRNDLVTEVKEMAFRCVRHALTSYLSLTSPARWYPVGVRHPFECHRLHSQHAVHGLFIVNDLPHGYHEGRDDAPLWHKPVHHVSPQSVTRSPRAG